MSETTTILVADQLQLIYAGLVEQFKSADELEIVAYAATGNAVLEYLQRDSVDLILLDVSLPGLDGIDTARAVKSAYPQQLLVAHSLLTEIEYVNSMLIEGASGYITKGADLDEFRLAINTIHGGEQYLSAAAKAAVEQGYSYTDKRMGGEYVGLKPREREIIVCIAREMTNKEIADQLCLSIETVRSYRKSLMTKLNVKNSAGLVKYAIDRRWI
ncbi:MAG: response regulator transcription factor [Gammaproteobacteria bacterium]|nr:response regulator transcription factor [Gammaproteobacteria bacterium]